MYEHVGTGTHTNVGAIVFKRATVSMDDITHKHVVHKKQTSKKKAITIMRGKSNHYVYPDI